MAAPAGTSPNPEMSRCPRVFARGLPVAVELTLLVEELTLAAVEFFRTLADVVETPLVLSRRTGLARVEGVDVK